MKEIKYTPRGFVIYDAFTDIYKAKVRVQQSSLATEHATWVFVEGGEVRSNSGSIHLDRKGVKRLRKALKKALQ